MGFRSRLAERRNTCTCCFLSLPPAVSVAEAMNKIKSNSSRWAHEEFPVMEEFAWQEGYGAFTVSRSNRDAVARYIADQGWHHRTLSFEDEFARFLEAHGLQGPESASTACVAPLGLR